MRRSSASPSARTEHRNGKRSDRPLPRPVASRTTEQRTPHRRQRDWTQPAPVSPANHIQPARHYGKDPTRPQDHRHRKNPQTPWPQSKSTKNDQPTNVENQSQDSGYAPTQKHLSRHCPDERRDTKALTDKTSHRPAHRPLRTPEWSNDAGADNGFGVTSDHGSAPDRRRDRGVACCPERTFQDTRLCPGQRKRLCQAPGADYGLGRCLVVGIGRLSGLVARHCRDGAARFAGGRETPTAVAGCRERRVRDTSHVAKGPPGTLNVRNGPFATSTMSRTGPSRHRPTPGRTSNPTT